MSPPKVESESSNETDTKSSASDKNESVNETDTESPTLTDDSVGRFSADYEELEQLGKGSYGCVLVCKHKLDHGEYAVKIVPFREEDLDKKLSEVRILRMLEHPNVVRYYQCWIEPLVPGRFDVPDLDVSTDDDDEAPAYSTLFIAMEHCTSSLKSILDDRRNKRNAAERGIKKEETLKWYKQLMEGLAHLHEKGVVHLDIKPDNLLVDGLDENSRLKIADFGLAALKDSEGHYSRPSYLNPVYLAPEMKDKSAMFTEKVDIFAAGLVLLEMERAPIETVSEKAKLFKDAKSGQLPEGMDREIRSYLEHSLKIDPDFRPTAKDIVRSMDS